MLFPTWVTLNLWKSYSIVGSGLVSSLKAQAAEWAHTPSPSSQGPIRPNILNTPKSGPVNHLSRDSADVQMTFNVSSSFPSLLEEVT